MSSPTEDRVDLEEYAKRVSDDSKIAYMEKCSEITQDESLSRWTTMKGLTKYELKEIRDKITSITNYFGNSNQLNELSIRVTSNQSNESNKQDKDCFDGKNRNDDVFVEKNKRNCIYEFRANNRPYILETLLNPRRMDLQL